MSEISVQESKQDQNALVLTISKQSFGEFIRDLISEKRQIRRDIKASFVFNRADLLDLIALINQRVNLQNQVILFTFSIEVLYRDGYTQGFQSLEAFNSSRDARQSEICAIHCLLTYVIKFPNREKPEKQEVSLFIRNLRAFEQSVTSKEALLWLPTFAFADETGTAHISLEYTEISWGYDLENLISQFLLGKMSKSKLTGFRFIIIAGILAATFAAILFYINPEANNYLEKNRANIIASIENNANLSPTDKILEKIDLLISPGLVTLSANQRKSIRIRSSGILVVCLTAILMIAIRRQSYLILNEFTERLYSQHKRRFDYIRYALATSFVVGLFASLGASVIYDFMKQ